MLATELGRLGDCYFASMTLKTHSKNLVLKLSRPAQMPPDRIQNTMNVVCRRSTKASINERQTGEESHVTLPRGFIPPHGARTLLLAAVEEHRGGCRGAEGGGIAAASRRSPRRGGLSLALDRDADA